MARLDPQHDVTDDTARPELLDGQPEERLGSPRPTPLDALGDSMPHLVAAQDVVAQVDDDRGQAAVGVDRVDVVEAERAQGEPLGQPRPLEPGEVASSLH
jgi:hypothetical protein